MPPVPLNNRQYLKKQYKDSSNLEVRIDLHRRFSTNKSGWFRWIFDHFNLSPRSRILELGSGTGFLWLQNLDRIPAGWEILLSDFSAGMLAQIRQNLEKYPQFQFKVIDAQSIPFENEYFDIVIANHMLYHVPDRPAALAEIRRVLNLAGHFYASTVGDRHFIEIRDLLVKFDPRLAAWGRVTDPFTIENGTAQLSQDFTGIKAYLYNDALEVTEVAPLVDYILSGWAKNILLERQAAFTGFVARAMESQGGVLHITKDSGLFECVRKGE